VGAASRRKETSMTNGEVLSLMLDHHRQLCDRVNELVSNVVTAVSHARSYDVERAQLVSYMIDEVLPHAKAEEVTIYAEAAKVPSLSATVETMIDEHLNLALNIERLARATNGSDTRRYATLVAGLLGSHVTTENEVLLPPLAADGSLSLERILTTMQQLTQNEPDPSSRENVAARDHEAVMLSNLLDAAMLLARGGSADEACSLVAATWAVLRVPRADLAVVATRSLHRLVRMATQEPVTLRSKDESEPDTIEVVLDVRSMPPAARHETIFTTYDNLEQGTTFLLVNDHDPKPLRYQFEAEHADQFTWDYLEVGPRVWRVRIGRPGATSTSGRVVQESKLGIR
jgi:uncharacterized protein (DUF2249 family)